MNETADKLAFSVDEAGVRAGIGRDKIYEAINAGELRARKNGRRTLILAAELEAYLENLPALEPKKAVA